MVYYGACLIIYAHFENSLFGSILKKCYFLNKHKLVCLLYNTITFIVKVKFYVPYHIIIFRYLPNVFSLCSNHYSMAGENGPRA